MSVQQEHQYQSSRSWWTLSRNTSIMWYTICWHKPVYQQFVDYFAVTAYFTSGSEHSKAWRAQRLKRKRAAGTHMFALVWPRRFLSASNSLCSSYFSYHWLAASDLWYTIHSAIILYLAQNVLCIQTCQSISTYDFVMWIHIESVSLQELCRSTRNGWLQQIDRVTIPYYCKRLCL